ncbi:hypothetical protein [Gilvibacter sp.]|nr:hypothetical protein [Gilvibacter sp.]
MVFLLLFVFGRVSAQEADSLYIKSYVDKIILKLNLDTQNNDF